MRINDFKAPTTTESTSAATAAAASKGTAEAQKSGKHAGAHHVKVSVSAQAKELAEKSGAGFDQAKVDRLKAAVEGGTLKVDSKAIASKIVGDDS